MAYTASSFAEILVGLYGWLLRPRSASALSAELFPRGAAASTRACRDPVMESVLLPLWAGFRRALIPLRAVQQGRIQQYLMYVLLTLCLLLASLFSLQDFVRGFLGW